MRTGRRSSRRRNALLGLLAEQWDSGRIPCALASLAGVALALGAILLFDARVRPSLQVIARAKVENAVTEAVGAAAARAFAENALGYEDLVTLERDGEGRITALRTDPVKLSRLRSDILGETIARVEELDQRKLGIPLGQLSGLAALSQWGPELPVRVRSVGRVGGNVRNSVTTVGAGRTCHRILLEVCVDLTILIPGGTVSDRIETQVCLAETVVLGQVPETGLSGP